MSFTFIHIRTFLALSAIGAGGFIFYPFLEKAFMANLYLNSSIVAIFAVGVVYAMAEMMALVRENRTLAKLKADEFSPLQRPYIRLMAPIVTLFSATKNQPMRFTKQEGLDKLYDAMEGKRENMRYFARMLIFLGLIGTFWGLLQTIQSVSGVIQNLSGDAASATAFASLKQQMAAPLEGMGLGFSSSLFGLTAALLMGFFDLQVGKAQSVFFHNADDLLTSVFAEQNQNALGGPARYELSSYIQVLWEKTLERLERLDDNLMQKEGSTKEMNQALVVLTERLSMLADHMREGQDQMLKVADNHQAIRGFLDNLQQQMAQQRLGVDDSTKAHIRNIDTHLERFNAEFDSNRSQVIQEMRNEIRLLAKTIAVSLEPRNVNQSQVSFKEKA